MFSPSVQTEVKAKNAKPCESFYQEINHWSKLDQASSLYIPHFSRRWDTRNPNTWVLQQTAPAAAAPPAVTQFDLRFVPAKTRCQKLMENTAECFKITAILLFLLKLDTTISHPQPPKLQLILLNTLKFKKLATHPPNSQSCISLQRSTLSRVTEKQH